MTDDAARMLDVTQRLMQALKPGDLDATLESITKAAVDMLPQVEYASISLVHDDGRLETVAPTADVVSELDAAQGRLHEGPCLESALTQTHMVSSNLAADERFPKYGPFAVSRGVRAQAGFPLFDTRKSHGALNLYSTRVGAFEDLDSLGALFSHQAGLAIAYAREVDNLSEAVRTRTIIGQATGIVMERYQLTDERAFAFLTRLSQHRNVKLRLVAQELIAASEARGDDEPPHSDLAM